MYDLSATDWALQSILCAVLLTGWFVCILWAWKRRTGFLRPVCWTLIGIAVAYLHAPWYYFALDDHATDKATNTDVDAQDACNWATYSLDTFLTTLLLWLALLYQWNAAGDLDSQVRWPVVLGGVVFLMWYAVVTRPSLSTAQSSDSAWCVPSDENAFLSVRGDSMRQALYWCVFSFTVVLHTVSVGRVMMWRRHEWSALLPDNWRTNCLFVMSDDQDAQPCQSRSHSQHEDVDGALDRDTALRSVNVVDEGSEPVRALEEEKQHQNNREDAAYADVLSGHQSSCKSRHHYNNNVKQKKTLSSTNAGPLYRLGQWMKEHRVATPPTLSFRFYHCIWMNTLALTSLFVAGVVKRGEQQPRQQQPHSHAETHYIVELVAHCCLAWAWSGFINMEKWEPLRGSVNQHFVRIGNMDVIVVANSGQQWTWWNRSAHQASVIVTAARGWFECCCGGLLCTPSVASMSTSESADADRDGDCDGDNSIERIMFSQRQHHHGMDGGGGDGGAPDENSELNYDEDEKEEEKFGDFSDVHTGPEVEAKRRFQEAMMRRDKRRWMRWLLADLRQNSKKERGFSANATASSSSVPLLDNTHGDTSMVGKRRPLSQSSTSSPGSTRSFLSGDTEVERITSKLATAHRRLFGHSVQPIDLVPRRHLTFQSLASWDVHALKSAPVPLSISRYRASAQAVLDDTVRRVAVDSRHFADANAAADFHCAFLFPFFTFTDWNSVISPVEMRAFLKHDSTLAPIHARTRDNMVRSITSTSSRIQNEEDFVTGVKRDSENVNVSCVARSRPVFRTCVELGSRSNAMLYKGICEAASAVSAASATAAAGSDVAVTSVTAEADRKTLVFLDMQRALQQMRQLVQLHSSKHTTVQCSSSSRSIFQNNQPQTHSVNVEIWRFDQYSLVQSLFDAACDEQLRLYDHIRSSSKSRCLPDSLSESASFSMSSSPVQTESDLVSERGDGCQCADAGPHSSCSNSYDNDIVSTCEATGSWTPVFNVLRAVVAVLDLWPRSELARFIHGVQICVDRIASAMWLCPGLCMSDVVIQLRAQVDYIAVMRHHHHDPHYALHHRHDAAGHVKISGVDDSASVHVDMYRDTIEALFSNKWRVDEYGVMNSTIDMKRLQRKLVWWMQLTRGVGKRYVMAHNRGAGTLGVGVGGEQAARKSFSSDAFPESESEFESTHLNADFVTRLYCDNVDIDDDATTWKIELSAPKDCDLNRQTAADLLVRVFDEYLTDQSPDPVTSVLFFDSTPRAGTDNDDDVRDTGREKNMNINRALFPSLFIGRTSVDDRVARRLMDIRDARSDSKLAVPSLPSPSPAADNVVADTASAAADVAIDAINFKVVVSAVDDHAITEQYALPVNTRRETQVFKNGDCEGAGVGMMVLGIPTSNVTESENGSVRTSASSAVSSMFLAPPRLDVAATKPATSSSSSTTLSSSSSSPQYAIASVDVDDSGNVGSTCLSFATCDVFEPRESERRLLARRSLAILKVVLYSYDVQHACENVSSHPLYTNCAFRAVCDLAPVFWSQDCWAEKVWIRYSEHGGVTLAKLLCAYLPLIQSRVDCKIAPVSINRLPSFADQEYFAYPIMSDIMVAALIVMRDADARIATDYAVLSAVLTSVCHKRGWLPAIQRLVARCGFLVKLDIDQHCRDFVARNLVAPQPHARHILDMLAAWCADERKDMHSVYRSVSTYVSQELAGVDDAELAGNWWRTCMDYTAFVRVACGGELQFEWQDVRSLFVKRNDWPLQSFTKSQSENADEFEFALAWVMTMTVLSLHCSDTGLDLAPLIASYMTRDTEQWMEVWFETDEQKRRQHAAHQESQQHRHLVDEQRRDQARDLISSDSKNESSATKALLIENKVNFLDCAAPLSTNPTFAVMTQNKCNEANVITTFRDMRAADVVFHENRAARCERKAASQEQTAASGFLDAVTVTRQNMIGTVPL